MVSFLMMIFFLVIFVSVCASGEMGNILQELIGLNRGLSICVVLIGSILIGIVSGGIGVAIEEYLSEHK